jgi:hypothetical protein
VAKLDKRLVMLIDPSQLLGAREVSAMEAIAQGGSAARRPRTPCCARPPELACTTPRPIMTLQRIPVCDLRVGMFLVRFDGAWLDHAAWRQKYRIASAEHLAAAMQAVPHGAGSIRCWGRAPMRPRCCCVAGRPRPWQ